MGILVLAPKSLPKTRTLTRLEARIGATNYYKLTLCFCDWWYTVRTRAIFLRTTAILASLEAAPPVT